MSNELTQYQRDVDRTLDELEGQISDAQNQVGVVGLQRLWQSYVAAQSFTETCGSINTLRLLTGVDFIVNNDTPLVTASVNLERNNAFSAGYIYMNAVGDSNTTTPKDLSGRLDTHNHTTGTTWSMLACSKTLAWKLPNGAYQAWLYIRTDDTGPVGQDCTLAVNSASLSVRSI